MSIPGIPDSNNYIPPPTTGQSQSQEVNVGAETILLLMPLDNLLNAINNAKIAPSCNPQQLQQLQMLEGFAASLQNHIDNLGLQGSISGIANINTEIDKINSFLSEIGTSPDSYIQSALTDISNGLTNFRSTLFQAEQNMPH